jgi:hypothetical protein
MKKDPAAISEQRIRFACVGSLVALALMVWSLLDPKPLAVIVAMSVGQALGTASLALFILVVVGDLRRAHLLDREERSKPSPPSSM